MTKKLILLNHKPKTNSSIYCIFSLLIVTFFFLSYLVESYDSYKVYGIIKCEEQCTITITLPFNKIDILNMDPEIKYLNKIYSIEKINYNEPYLSDEIPYQDIDIITSIESKDKIISFQILYNKQRIIKKIKNIIIERQ